MNSKLKEYLQHKKDCNKWDTREKGYMCHGEYHADYEEFIDDRKKCTCGLDAALAEEQVPNKNIKPPRMMTVTEGYNPKTRKKKKRRR